ncbi:flippase [Alphaproteobacteria bacterium LSUCC0684]
MKMSFLPHFLKRHVEGRPYLAKVFANIGWLSFDKFIRMGVGVFISVWVARYLGPEQFGLLNFSTAFVGLFGAISALGLESIVVRDLVEKPQNASKTLGTSLVMQVTGGVLSYFFIISAIFILRPDDKLSQIAVAILGLMMLCKGEIAVYWFESKVQSKYTVWVQNSVFLLFATIKLVLIIHNANLIFFVWAVFAEVALVALLLLYVMNRKGPALKNLRFNLDWAQHLLKESWPLILSGISISIYMKIDQLMLGQILNDKAVGIYSAALRFSEIWHFIPIVIVASVFPAIVYAKNVSESLYNERMQKLFNLMITISLFLSLPMTFLAKPLMHFLYGPAFEEAGTVLAIHIWSSVFVFIGVASSKWMVIENLQLITLQRSILGAVVNIGLNMWLIPINGVIGAASATIISFSISTYFADVINTKTRKLFMMKSRSLFFMSFMKMG